MPLSRGLGNEVVSTWYLCAFQVATVTDIEVSDN